MKNVHAQELAKLARGIPKNFSEEEREKRRGRMADVRKFKGNSRNRRKQKRARERSGRRDKQSVETRET